jgi:hypothetical protein
MRADGGLTLEDGFAALFLIRLLWANDPLLLRGQYNGDWKLIPSIERAKQKGSAYIQDVTEKSTKFLKQVVELDFIKRAYGASVPPMHQLALLQHYGFPSPLLDCTYSYDVALFFAEGGLDYKPRQKEYPSSGAIFAIPTQLLPESAVLISMPPAVMRPNLQRGVFIMNLSVDDLARLEKQKFIFKHKRLPIWNAIGGIPYGGAADIGNYLFPVSDPIERIGHPIEEKQLTFGETPEGIWFKDMYQNCLQELPGGRQSVDINLMVEMCKNDPRCALIGVQMLVHLLLQALGGKPIAEAPDEAAMWRLLLGTLPMAYSISRGEVEHVPPELAKLFEMHPVIPECVSFVASYNLDLQKKRIAAGRDPRDTSFYEEH